MASSPEYVSFVCAQLADAGTVTGKKMFGEYGLYLDGKFFALICDNQFFIKITKAGAALLPDCPTVPPYEGASLYFLMENIENAGFLCRFARETCAELPFPKPKKKKTDESACFSGIE